MRTRTPAAAAVALTAAVALLASSLTGCVRVDTGPEAGAPPPAKPSSTSAPSGSSTSTPGGSDSSTTGPASTTTGSATSSPTAAAKKVDLSGGEGTVYVRAIQAFSPELEVWRVDLEGKKIAFDKYNCAGRKVAAVRSIAVEPATVAQPPEGAEVVQATWPSGKSNPYYPLSGSPTTTFEVFEGYLRPRGTGDTATTDAEMATGSFVNSCGDTAGVVLDFVL